MPGWRLQSPPGSQPFPDTVLAGGGGRPWLIGGVIVTPEPATPEGLVVANEARRVAIWEARAPGGPWKLVGMNAVAGRDGPFETVLYLARRATASVAFGSRASPTEGYPRPSTWTRTMDGWSEKLAPRELFGGPDIVGYGGMATGPGGFFLAGTWSDSRGHAEASVWGSPDGSRWSRASAQTFEGTTGETPFGEGVADNEHGVVLIATAEAPTNRDPASQHGAAWFSGDGASWARLGPGVPGRSTFGAVVAETNDWVIAGTIGSSGRERAAVWTVGTDVSIHPARPLPGPPTSHVRITAAWSSGSRTFVAGVADGHPALWSAPNGASGIPSKWSRIQTPPGSLADLQRVSGSSSPGSTLLVMIGKASSEVWDS